MTRLVPGSFWTPVYTTSPRGSQLWFADCERKPAYESNIFPADSPAGPHQDDECLQTAGIIYQAAHSGAHVSVCFATNGEYASEADAAVRTAESRSVLAALGVPAEQIYFLGYPDTGMPYEESFLRRLYDGCRVSASRWGRTETWRPDGQDFHFMRSGCHSTYTAASVLRDLSDVLALVNPDTVYVTAPRRLPRRS